MLETLIAIALLMQSLLSGFSVTPTKENLYKWSKEINPAYKMLGYDLIDDLSITWEAIPHTRGAAGAPYWQSNKWCGRFFSLDVGYKFPHNVWYGTPEIVWVLAHEQSHTYQGVECDSWYREQKAQEMTMFVLYETDKEVYKQALYSMIREMAVIRAVDVSCQQGLDYSWVKEFEQYQDIKCWQARNFRPYTQPLIDLLLDENGILDHYNYIIDLSGVKELIQND